MNTPSLPHWILLAGLGLLPQAAWAQQSQGFTLGETGLNQPIPDNDASGIARTYQASGLAVGVPYTLTVSLSVEPTGFGAFNGDYYAYLLHETPTGSGFGLAVLMNRVGSSVEQPSGYSDSGFSFTFADAAEQDVHKYRVSLGGAATGIATGTWQPDGRRVDPLVSLDTSARTALLAPLGQMDPNGQWTLFIADVETGGTGKLTSWQVRATAVVPEPTSVMLLGLGSLAWVACRRRRRSA